MADAAQNVSVKHNNRFYFAIGFRPPSPRLWRTPSFPFASLGYEWHAIHSSAAPSEGWWRWRESNPRVDTVQNRSLHAYFVVEFAYRPVGPPANKRTFRTIRSEISPEPGRKRFEASTMNDTACRLLCLGGAMWREIKPPEQTLRSQLLF